MLSMWAWTGKATRASLICSISSAVPVKSFISSNSARGGCTSFRLVQDPLGDRTLVAAKQPSAA
jgi:hypothetical protein